MTEVLAVDKTGLSYSQAYDDIWQLLGNIDACESLLGGAEVLGWVQFPVGDNADNNGSKRPECLVDYDTEDGTYGIEFPWTEGLGLHEHEDTKTVGPSEAFFTNLTDGDGDTWQQVEADGYRLVAGGGAWGLTRTFAYVRERYGLKVSAPKAPTTITDRSGDVWTRNPDGSDDWWCGHARASEPLWGRDLDSRNTYSIIAAGYGIRSES